MIQMPSPACSFSGERLSRVAEMEGWHFWFVGRRALIARLLARHLSDEGGKLILDVGCGTGRTLEMLTDLGHQAIGLDLRSEGLKLARVSASRARVVQADALALPFRNDAFDAVLLLDVLEHVDDQRLLIEVRRVLRTEGLAIITVPAVQWLWSFRDANAGHLRRYKAGHLRSICGRQGLTLVDFAYYQCLLLPLLMLCRLLGSRGPLLRDLEERPFALLNSVFRSINLSEVALGRRVRWPWGSSIVVVCRKESID